MLRAPHRLLGFASVATALATACSGSSSESPWPVEPNEIEVGPEGEDTRRGTASRKSPSRPPDDDDYGASGGGKPTRRRPTAEPDPSERGLAP